MSPRDTSEVRPVDLSPNTHFRLTLAKAVAVIGGIGIIVATAASTYTSITTSLHSHIDDNNRHLPEDFTIHHGAPAGMWDVETIHREDKEMSESVKKSIDELTLQPLHFEDCYCAGKTIHCRLRH